MRNQAVMKRPPFYTYYHQFAIYNLFLYLKDLCNKEIDCLSKIIEKNFKKKNNKKKTENVWSVHFIPLETLNESKK